MTLDKWTRRSVLKTGLVATAGLIGTKNALGAGTPTTGSELNQHDSPVGDKEFQHPSSLRQKVLLDQSWRFHLGNAIDAHKDFSFGLPMVEATFAKSGQIIGHNYGQHGKIVQLQVDDSNWSVIDLPHDWAVELSFVEANGPDISAHAAHGGKPLGREFPETSIGWYRRKFDIPAKDEGLRITITFDGIFRDAMILLNGFYLGKNMSGYSPCSYDITDYVLYGGENLLVVRVDASMGEGWYYEGAGIYRHSWLTKTHPLHIGQWGTCVRSEVRKADALLSLETEIQNDAPKEASGRLISQIVDTEGKLVAVASAQSFTIPANETLSVKSQAAVVHPALWSIETPNLYRVVTRIESNGAVTDHHEANFGIRTVRFDPDRGFFLNNKPVKLKGICNHQDHAGVGIAIPDRIHYERVAAFKKMGANAWRTAHNPVSTELLDACDRQGMLVMSEVRLMSSSPEGLSELERMVARDRNHPSIILWSMANEEHFQSTAQGARIVASMKRLTKKLDPTRPVTAAMNGGWGVGISPVLDIMGFNYWNTDRISGPDVANNIDNYHRQFPAQPCIGSETGTGHGTRGIYQDDPARGHVSPYSSKDRTVSAEIWWKVYAERAFLAGGFAWSGFDYRGEPKPYDHVSINSQSGILDTCGFPKDVYYYYKSWWSVEPVLHLSPHWNWNGKEGTEIEVLCYSNLESVELLLNGKSLGSKPVPRYSHLQWTVKYESGVLEVHGSRGGKVVLTSRRETTGAPARLVLRPSQSVILADGVDVSCVTVEVQDAAGRIHPTAGNKVQFKVKGVGRILGVGNGDPGCHEADKPEHPEIATRSAFNGLCLAIVQSTTQAGPIQLEVTADGLVSARITIESRSAA